MEVKGITRGVTVFLNACSKCHDKRSAFEVKVSSTGNQKNGVVIHPVNIAVFHRISRKTQPLVQDHVLCLGTMDVCKKCHGIPSNSCWDTSAWIVELPTNYAFSLSCPTELLGNYLTIWRRKKRTQVKKVKWKKIPSQRIVWGLSKGQQDWFNVLYDVQLLTLFSAENMSREDPSSVRQNAHAREQKMERWSFCLISIIFSPVRINVCIDSHARLCSYNWKKAKLTKALFTW